MVFCNTRQLTREVCEHLNQAGIHAEALHGDMEQRDRDQVLIQFRHLSCSILVATDVAARGLDIDDLPAVINFELPRNAEVYVHRIGRTGRAGKAGLALSLFADSERYKLQAIGDYLQREVDFEAIETVAEAAGVMPLPALRHPVYCRWPQGKSPTRRHSGCTDRRGRDRRWRGWQDYRDGSCGLRGHRRGSGG